MNLFKFIFKVKNAVVYSKEELWIRHLADEAVAGRPYLLLKAFLGGEVKWSKLGSEAAVSSDGALRVEKDLYFSLLIYGEYLSEYKVDMSIRDRLICAAVNNVWKGKAVSDAYIVEQYQISAETKEFEAPSPKPTYHPHIKIYRGIWRLSWRVKETGDAVQTDRVPIRVRMSKESIAVHSAVGRMNHFKGTAYRREPTPLPLVQHSGIQQSLPRSLCSPTTSGPEE